MQEQLKHIWSTHGYYVGYQGKQVDFDIQWLLASGSLLIFAWSSKIKDIEYSSANADQHCHPVKFAA